jgi:thiamine kinase-like enzyme
VTTPDLEISADLQKEISATITKELSLESPPILRYKIIYDDDRRIYKIKIENQKAFFVLKIRGLKIVKQQDHDIEDLKKEFKLLENAWDSAKNMPQQLGMSKPVKLWVSEKAMLLSGCRGKNFNDWFNQHIFKWAFKSQALNSAICQTGSWLGEFHKNASKTSALKDQFDNRVDNLTRMVCFLKTNSRHNLSEEKLDTLLSSFKNLTAQESDGPMGQIHGNFAYRNILYSPSQINLVDFEDAHIEHVSFDIGQFLAEIMFKSQFPWLRHLTKKLTNSFKQGYQQHFQLQKNITHAYLGYHLLVHLYEHCSRKKPQGIAGLVLTYRIRYLTKLVENWTSESSF